MAGKAARKINPTQRGHGSGEDDSVLRGRSVAAAIRQEILDGQLKPGERIRQETLAIRLGSSRIPVREALRQLESEGLVVLVPNSGAWIARLDRAKCIEIYKIRERIEPLALGESVARLESADLAELARLVEEIEKDTTVDGFLVRDREFHLLSYKGAPLPTLRRMIFQFWNTTQHYRRAYITLIGGPNRWIIHAEHRLILEAIRRRDAEEAEVLLRAHIRRTRQELERNEEIFGPG